MNLRTEKRSIFLTLFIFGIYIFRFAFCFLGYLKNYQWLDNGDESHVYLLGLKYFTSNQYPNWGPDIVFSQSYMVGGLQGLAIGLPLSLWHHPFAPYLLLFCILSANLIYLSWYISKIFPIIPKWLIYCLVAISPFSMHTGLKIINPAYVLCFAIPFMLSFIEVLSVFKKQYINPNWRFFWMGLGVTAVFQLHASWVVLFLMLFTAILYQLTLSKNIAVRLETLIFSGIGLFIGFLPIIPVIYHYGTGIFLQQGNVLQFSWSHIIDFGTLIFDFVMLSGYEMNTFSSVYAWDSLVKNEFTPGAILFAILQIIGFLIFASQILMLFIKKNKYYIIEYKRFLLLCVGTIIPLTIIYMFSYIRPLSYTIVILFPLSILFFFLFINYLMVSIRVNLKYIAIFTLLVIAYYIVVIKVTNKLPSLGYRQKAFAAIEKKDASIFETTRFSNKPTPIR